MQFRYHQRAFTLLELMLVVAIAIVILGIAVPSLSGLSAERRLHATFDRFDEFVRGAQLQAVSTQRTCTLVWQGSAITLQPDDPTPEEQATGEEALHQTFVFDENETFAIERPASLLSARETPASWTFWRSGTCEPVLVRYSGPDGLWTAQYNPLTGHGELIEQLVQ